MKFMTLTETLISRATSLKAKFPSSLVESPSGKEEVERFISDLLCHTEVPISGGPSGPVGNMIHKLFVAAQKVRYTVTTEGIQYGNSDFSSLSDFSDKHNSKYRMCSCFKNGKKYCSNSYFFQSFYI